MSETEPPPFVTFREPRPPPPDVYQTALDFTARVFAIIQLAELERFHLKDQLDRRSTVIALLVAQARELPHGSTRRTLYDQARKAAMDCRSILDIVGTRNTVEVTVLDPARELVVGLVARLTELART